MAGLATICHASFFDENNAITEDKSIIQDEQNVYQRQVDQLAKALKSCYDTPSTPPITGFLKRDYWHRHVSKKLTISTKIVSHFLFKLNLNT